jgi:hypothetical protein
MGSGPQPVGQQGSPLGLAIVGDLHIVRGVRQSRVRAHEDKAENEKTRDRNRQNRQQPALSPLFTDRNIRASAVIGCVRKGARERIALKAQLIGGGF